MAKIKFGKLNRIQKKAHDDMILVVLHDKKELTPLDGADLGDVELRIENNGTVELIAAHFAEKNKTIDVNVPETVAPASYELNVRNTLPPEDYFGYRGYNSKTGTYYYCKGLTKAKDTKRTKVEEGLEVLIKGENEVVGFAITPKET